MKVLLDECVPQAFRHHITGHDVFTVGYLAWKSVKNGALLTKAVSEGFGAFVTTDRGVEAQQNIPTLPIAVIVLHAHSNDLDDLLPFVPQLLVTLNHAQPGKVTHLHPP